MGADDTPRPDPDREAAEPQPTGEEAEMSRSELERETPEVLPDREGTFNALSDQATLERHPEAEDETTTRGGPDV